MPDIFGTIIHPNVVDKADKILKVYNLIPNNVIPHASIVHLKKIDMDEYKCVKIGWNEFLNDKGKQEIFCESMHHNGFGIITLDDNISDKIKKLYQWGDQYFENGNVVYKEKQAKGFEYYNERYVRETIQFGCNAIDRFVSQKISIKRVTW